LRIGNFTISYITLIMPHNICREADRTMFTAKFPYIIVLTVDLAGPPEASKVREAPMDSLLMSVYHTISRHLPGNVFSYQEVLSHRLPRCDDLEEFRDEESNFKGILNLKLISKL
jgi:hypothetical protein